MEEAVAVGHNLDLAMEQVVLEAEEQVVLQVQVLLDRLIQVAEEVVEVIMVLHKTAEQEAQA
jgi:hypothetical protein